MQVCDNCVCLSPLPRTYVNIWLWPNLNFWQAGNENSLVLLHLLSFFVLLQAEIPATAVLYVMANDFPALCINLKTWHLVTLSDLTISALTVSLNVWQSLPRRLWYGLRSIYKSSEMRWTWDMAYACTGQVVMNLHAVYHLSAMACKSRPMTLFGSSSQNKVDFFVLHLVQSTVYSIWIAARRWKKRSCWKLERSPKISTLCSHCRSSPITFMHEHFVHLSVLLMCYKR